MLRLKTRPPRTTVAIPRRTLYVPLLGSLPPSLTVPSLALASLLLFATQRYRISKPDEYLVRTGLGIKDMSITKKALQWPFQTFQYIKLHPHHYAFDLQAMSSEKLEFTLPGSFTIGPKDDPEELRKYLRLLHSGPAQAEVAGLVKGILEGETRIQAAQMTLDEIFNDRKRFQEHLINIVQTELNEFGLCIYNANIKELQDGPGSEYFSFLRQKKRSEAENTAKVDVAEANKWGALGAKEREAATRQRVADFEAESVLVENSQREVMARSEADLAVVRAGARRVSEVARIEAENVARLREAELQRDVEQRRIALQTERLRALHLSRAQVEAEAQVKTAEGQAEAVKVRADAELFSARKQAEGVLAVYNAQAEGMQKLLGGFRGQPEELLQYLMVEGGVYERLAESNAEAIGGLEPEMTVWMMEGGGLSGWSKEMMDVMRTIPPLVSTIRDQTGIVPSQFLLEMSEKEEKKGLGRELVKREEESKEKERKEKEEKLKKERKEREERERREKEREEKEKREKEEREKEKGEKERKERKEMEEREKEKGGKEREKEKERKEKEEREKEKERGDEFKVRTPENLAALWEKLNQDPSWKPTATPPSFSYTQSSVSQPSSYSSPSSSFPYAPTSSTSYKPSPPPKPSTTHQTSSSHKPSTTTYNTSSHFPSYTVHTSEASSQSSSNYSSGESQTKVLQRRRDVIAKQKKDQRNK